MKQEMKSKRRNKRVQGKEKKLNKMRKIRILYSDPYATDYSSEEEQELFLRNDYQLDGSKKIVKEIFVPFMPLAYENKKNAFEDVKEVLLYQTSPSSVLDVTVTDTKAAKDINDINGLVKEEDIKIKELTSDEERGNVVEGVCNKEDISIQYMQEEPNVASLVGHDHYILDEMEMLLGDGFCNLLDKDEINCGSMWKVEHDKGSSILPHIDCDFNDTELGWIDETLNWDCH